MLLQLGPLYVFGRPLKSRAESVDNGAKTILVNPGQLWDPPTQDAQETLSCMVQPTAVEHVVRPDTVAWLMLFSTCQVL